MVPIMTIPVALAWSGKTLLDVVDPPLDPP
jgi:hypothetical protein